MESLFMRKTLLISLLIVFIQGCLNENQESPIITQDPAICSAQPLKNAALWDYMNDWYLWNESLDQTTRVEEFASLADVFIDIKEKNPQDRFSYIMSKKEFDDYFHTKIFHAKDTEKPHMAKKRKFPKMSKYSCEGGFF